MPMATKEAQREYQRKWMARRRKEWLDANGPCVECGSEENLQVDHINPEDKVEHKVWSWAEGRRLAELAKCQVLCLPCHQAKTSANGEYARGTTNGQSKLTDEQVMAIRLDVAAGGQQIAWAYREHRGRADCDFGLVGRRTHTPGVHHG